MQGIKFYVIGFILMGFSLQSVAQNDKKVNLALTIAPSVAWLDPSNAGYSSEGTKMGFKYGLLVDFRLFGDDNYSFSSGFTMNHTGGKLSEPTAVVNEKGILVAARSSSVYNMNYIDVPLLIRLKSNELGYNTFYGVFGSEVGFNIKARNDYTLSWNGAEIEGSEDVSSDINLFRSSLVFGIGVERNISGNTYFRVGFTYHNGLTNIMEGKSYVLDGNGETLIDIGGPIEDKDLNTKLKFVELNLAILF